MFPMTVILAAVAVAIAAAGCGSDTDGPRSPTAASSTTTSRDPTVMKLDGLYGATLDRRALRRALAPITPPLELPGGWWTLKIDAEARRLVLSHPSTGDFTERITAVEDAEIRLAPSLECEQRGPGRTQPARLAWFKSGDYLRFKAIDVPCLTSKILLTMTAWRTA